MCMSPYEGEINRRLYLFFMEKKVNVKRGGSELTQQFGA